VKTLATFGFIFLSFSGQLSGQQYHFEKITELQGLSDNRVTCFLKDRTGFLWIGTANGLNRYDGHEFRTYRPGQHRYKISHEQINDIEQDAQGSLWIATWNGINLLNPETDSLIIFTPDKDDYSQKKNKISSSLTWDIYIDRAGLVWIAPDARDLCYYDPSSREFTYFPWREFVKTRLPQRSRSNYTAIQKIERKSADELWLGTTLGLFSFHTNTHVFRYHGGDDPFDFISIYHDSIDQHIFFGQENLYVYDIRNERLKKITPESDRQLIPTGKLPVLIPTLTGLWTIHPESQKASRVFLDSKDPFSLHHKNVNTVYQDRETLWIGTSDGIRLYDRYLNLFHFTPLLPDTLHASAGNIFHVLDNDRHQRYYFSSYTGNRLIIINKQNGERQELTSIAGKPLLKCSRTFEDSKQRLWVLTLGFDRQPHIRF
jgi:ligand-binding sensor domain-containing protein